MEVVIKVGCLHCALTLGAIFIPAFVLIDDLTGDFSFSIQTHGGLGSS